jgi:hypothetical protein
VTRARDWSGSCCRRDIPRVAEPLPNSSGWPKVLAVVADVPENHGGAAKDHRSHGTGNLAAAKLILMLCTVEAAPDIGSILHLAPPLLVVPSIVSRESVAYH